MKAKWPFVFLALVLLPACSTMRLAYENADLFPRWQANNYFDFQGAQSEELDRRLAAFLAWHRAKALPQYARLSEQAAARLRRGIKREDLEWGYDSVMAQVREALGAAALEAAGLLEGWFGPLSSEQREHAAERLKRYASLFESMALP